LIQKEQGSRSPRRSEQGLPGAASREATRHFANAN
jgi:hypothetical protein